MAEREAACPCRITDLSICPFWLSPPPGRPFETWPLVVSSARNDLAFRMPADHARREGANNCRPVCGRRPVPPLSGPAMPWLLGPLAHRLGPFSVVSQGGGGISRRAGACKERYCTGKRGGEGGFLAMHAIMTAKAKERKPVGGPEVRLWPWRL